MHCKNGFGSIYLSAMDHGEEQGRLLANHAAVNRGKAEVSISVTYSIIDAIAVSVVSKIPHGWSSITS